MTEVIDVLYLTLAPKIGDRLGRDLVYAVGRFGSKPMLAENRVCRRVEIGRRVLRARSFEPRFWRARRVLPGFPVDEISLVKRSAVASKFQVHRAARSFRGVVATIRIDDQSLLAKDSIAAAAALAGVEGVVSVA